MRNIRDLMEQRKFLAIPEQIRSMKRLWPRFPGLGRQRDAEADLFEKGLGITDRVKSAIANLASANRPERVAARRALAEAYQAGTAKYYTQYLFAQMEHNKSFRNQFGILTALGDVKGGWQASADQRAKLVAWQAERGIDANIRIELRNAISNMK